jgi:prophage regulatory protein
MMHVKRKLTPRVVVNPHDIPDILEPSKVRLLSKPEIVDRTNLSYPTIWQKMRAGTFPRSRIVGGKVMWLESEFDSWVKDLPKSVLKGDAEAGE